MIRAFVKTFLLVLVLALAMPLMWVISRFAPTHRFRLLNASSRLLLRIIGVRFLVKGAPSLSRPLLLVSNHTSYLDVLLLGAVLPVRFTPKSDIAKWPVVGAICRMIGCVFIDRKATRTTDNQEKLVEALEQGACVSLFPEGTTNDGKRVLPFRSSYFSLAERTFTGRALAVQPAVIRYTRINGMPVGHADKPLIAWYGDMDLVPHAAALLKLGVIDAEIEFLPQVEEGTFENRKALAAHCQRVIADIF